MTRTLSLLALLSLSACGLEDPSSLQGLGVSADAKGSTVSTSDTAPYPIYRIYYKDADGDGFGNPLSTRKALAQPVGYVTNSLDCDDGDKAVHPKATEVCDDRDNDCDGSVDEGLKLDHFFQDADGDGFGDASVMVDDCGAPEGFVEDATDCDDSLDTVFPGAPELCDGEDNDCDGGGEHSALWGGHQYLFCYLPEIVTDWSSAAAACEANPGMKLVKISDRAEQTWVDGTWDGLKLSSVITWNHVDAPEYVAWIGLSDQAVEDDWRYMDGSTVTDPTLWCDGEPNDAAPAPGEDCAVTGWTAAGYGSCADEWNDIPCDTPAAFICESGF